MKANVMQSMWDCDINGWLRMALMSGVAFFTMLVLLLAALALGRYVVSGPRRA
jgi:hypothetical protein